MRRLFRRGLRLELVAALGVALMMPAMAVSAESARGIATQTSLAVDARDQGGSTHANLAITVVDEDGVPASGEVSIQDHGKAVAGVALDAEGHATASVELAPGDHSLRAVYGGDAAHVVSHSEISTVHALAGTTPDFTVSVAPATLSLTQGQSGSVIVSVTPINAASLTAPMFVTVSCSGLPDQSSCTFTPESVQILPNATTASTSSMVLATKAQSLVKVAPPALHGSNPVAWAILLPGTLGLAGLAFGARRRRWLSRVALMALVGFVTVLGATGCSPLYDYHHHGPSDNLPTPPGTFTVSINAQSSNGVTANTKTVTMALTVKTP